MPHWTRSRPAGSAQLMIALAREKYGLSTETCAQGTGLVGDDLVDPAREITGRQELGVLRNILRVLKPGTPFGLEAGLRYRATTHGLFGFLMITSRDVRQAMEVAVRFFDLTYSFNCLSYELDEHQARVLFDDSANPDDLRAALVERDLGALAGLRRDILRVEPPLNAMRLRAKRPPYVRMFEELFSVVPEFEAAENSIVVDVRWLDASSPLAEEFAFRVCEDQCRALLERREANWGMAGRVRALILKKPGEFPNMARVADELGTTTRTLRNQLAREGTSFRGLIEELRQALAEELLSSNGVNIDQIAERLGYTDTSSFIAAFKRWKGVPPRVYRGH